MAKTAEPPVAVGRRPVGTLGDLTAWLSSFTMHAAALLVLGVCTQVVPVESIPMLLTTPLAEAPPEEEEAFRVSEDLAIDVGALSDGGVGDGAASAPLEADLPEVELDLETLRDLGQIPTLEADTPLLASPNPDDKLVVRGLGAVGDTGSAGAVDRLTGEILLSLEYEPTLVVWLFDSTASLQPQRDAVVGRFDKVYEELGVAADRGAAGLERGDDEEPPLLTTVASFGARVEFVTERPTDDLDEIKQAVRSISIGSDDSGQENVFNAVLEAVERHQRFINGRPKRKVMIVVFTDESGDDVANLDRAVKVCRKMQTPVYVVGAPAPFGRQESYVRYVDPDPKYDQSTQWLAVRQGPESLAAERLRLGSFGRGDFTGPQLDSGFGPFGLSRLAAESGGFFIAVHPFRVDAGPASRRPEENSLVAELDYFFDARVMNRYRPDYLPTAEYQRRVQQNGAMRALVQAAELSWTGELENVRREFPKLDEAQFAEDLSRAQQAAARLEQPLSLLAATLRRGEADRPKIDSPRWQAGFDLAIGHALASKVRTEGYNTMLASAKQGMPFSGPKKDTWILDPSDKIESGSLAEREAADAKRYLERVVKDHPETPWAHLAQRELQTPMGWKWRDEFRNLAEIARRQQENQNRPRPPRPEPPPKPKRTPKL